MAITTLNRSDILKAAWVGVKVYFQRCIDRSLTPRFTLRELLSRELRRAWSNAKMALYRAQLEQASPADKIRAALSNLENKDTWSEDDYATHDRLLIALRAVETDGDVLDREEKRDLIESAAGRFASVTFIKKDGSDRTMKVQPAKLKFHVKGDQGAPAARRASSIRKSRHPHLMPVWDVEAQAPRSVNLATVKAITVDGVTRAYA